MARATRQRPRARPILAKRIDMPKLTPTERFWKRVEVTAECWPWLGGMSAGRPMLYVGQVRGYVYARRFSWELHFGEIVGDMIVVTTCESSSCMRPDHLKLMPRAHVGTQPIAALKRCRGCQVTKATDEFPRKAQKSDGLESYCTICTRAKMRNWNLSKYGITTVEYERMLASQEGRCAACHSTNSGTKRGLVVDHNHSTGGVRALLCNSCNCAIGHAADDPARLRLMADYLERMVP